MLEESLMKTGAFKQRTDFYTLNQLVNLDATFNYIFGHANPLFRKLLIAKLSDEGLFNRSKNEGEKIDYRQILKGLVHLINFD
jgi:hypothetical protein